MTPIKKDVNSLGVYVSHDDEEQEKTTKVYLTCQKNEGKLIEWI